MLDLIFDIRSFWHAGSGHGKSQALDMLVIKDLDGLPYLPGRTVKGLLRDAVQRAEHWDRVPEKLTDLLFGTEAEVKKRTRFETDPGLLSFNDARLPDDLADWIVSRDSALRDPALREGFYQEIHATSIDPDTGCAREGSLRGMEVTIPLKISARIMAQPGRTIPAVHHNWIAEIRRCLPLIRGLGVGRTRGLGRCRVTLEEVRL